MVWQADLHTDGTNTGMENGKKDVLTTALHPTGQFRGQSIRILSLDDPVPDYALQIAEVEAIGRLASAPPLPKLMSIGQNGANLVVQWSQGGTLQTADGIIGPWTDISGAASPFTFAPSGVAKFFRVNR